MSINAMGFNVFHFNQRTKLKDAYYSFPVKRNGLPKRSVLRIGGPIDKMNQIDQIFFAFFTIPNQN